MAEKGKAAITKTPFSFKKNSDLATKYKTPEDVFEHVVKQVNPGYGAPGTATNCRRATFAYEMRRRGYDVAATRTTTGSGQTAYGLYDALTPGSNITKSGKHMTIVSQVKAMVDTDVNNSITEMTNVLPGGGKKRLGTPVEGIFGELSKQPDGSRGELGVMWDNLSGHSLAYEIFNGKAVVFDTQMGKQITEDNFHDIYPQKVTRAAFTRLDNLDLNEDFLMKWVRNA